MNPKLIPYGTKIFFDYHDNMNVICKEHMVRADFRYDRQDLGYSYFQCLEGPHEIILGELVDDIRERLLRRIASKRCQEAEFFDVDGYLVPASKEAQAKSKDHKYFIRAQVKHSDKKGAQVVVYAGREGLNSKKERSQIFIDPENRKMTFDQNDANPNDMFVKLEATFRDGSKTTIAGPEIDEEDK